MHSRSIDPRGFACSAAFLTFLAVIVSFVALLPARMARADEPEVVYEKDVVYGKVGDEELKLDIATPKGLDHAVPAIIFIHGGGWRAGNRKDLEGLTKQAAGRGYVAATISYRFAPKYLFPAQVEDAKCAVR